MEVVFVRHGKPEAANNPTLCADGFADWLYDYEQSKIEASSMPSEQARKLTSDGSLVLSSNLRRAIHSAQICLGKDPDLQLNTLRELEIPSYKLPFKAKAYTWMALSVTLWRLGVKSEGEGVKEAKLRAQKAAAEIDKLSKKTGKVVVFGHGLFNRYIAKALKRLGWRGQHSVTRYWGVIVLKSPGSNQVNMPEHNPVLGAIFPALIPETRLTNMQRHKSPEHVRPGLNWRNRLKAKLSHISPKLPVPCRESFR